MNKWILVADASRARIFSTHNAQTLKMERALTHPASRERTSDLVSDQQGRVQKGMGRNVGSSMEPPTSAHEVEAENFAAELGRALKDGHDQNSYEAVLLVAPPHFLGLLRKHLGAQVEKRLAGTLSKDYTHATEGDLTEMLKEHL